MVKTLRTSLAVRPISLAARGPKPTDREAGSAERAKLYGSARWQRARLRFLQANPLCIACTAGGLVVAADVVDHRDGHRNPAWRARFWDEATWQPMCRDCHASKSASELAEWQRGGDGLNHG
jgi:5-methylcytosine-specific restriction protein A